MDIELGGNGICDVCWESNQSLSHEKLVFIGYSDNSSCFLLCPAHARELSDRILAFLTTIE